MAKDDEDDRPKKKIAHEIGQELTLLSVTELTVAVLSFQPTTTTFTSPTVCFAVNVTLTVV